MLLLQQVGGGLAVRAANFDYLASAAYSVLKACRAFVGIDCEVGSSLDIVVGGYFAHTATLLHASCD